jgi:hypothetical protein
VLLLAALLLAPLDVWAQDEAPPADAEVRGALPTPEPQSRPAPAPRPRYTPCVPSCRVGFDCIAGQCRSQCNPPCDAASDCLAYECRPRVRVVPERLPGMKSPGGAFALEFLLGFGIGGYYAGSVGFGLSGTVGSILEVAGIALLFSAQGEGGLVPLVLSLVAVPFRLTAIIGAPVAAARHNRELRRRAGILFVTADEAPRRELSLAPERRPQSAPRNVALARVPVLAW